MARWKVISPAEVARNNTERSCWLIIADMVYDVTDYMHDHPGGYEVLFMASGGDATHKFESVGHSSNARALLKPYCIGTIKELGEEDKEIESREIQRNSRNFERIVIYVVLLYLMAIVVKFRWIPGAIVLMCAVLVNECV